MAKFRKKPVVIDAMEWTGRNGFDLMRWGEQLGGEIRWRFETGPLLFIQTLEGDMRADPGDWVIRGVRGEFYPCKPDIFAATYEPADIAPLALGTCPACRTPGVFDEGSRVCTECSPPPSRQR